MGCKSKFKTNSLVGNKSKEDVQRYIYELIPNGTFAEVEAAFESLMGVIENEFDEAFFKRYPKEDRNPLFYS